MRVKSSQRRVGGFAHLITRKKSGAAQGKVVRVMSTVASHLFRPGSHFCVFCSADNPTAVRQRSPRRWTGRVTERKGRRSRRKGEKRTQTLRE